MLKIIGIRNEATESNYTKIVIKDISTGGIRIHTPLRFPVNMNLLLEFTFQLFSQDFKILGTITRKNTIGPSLFEYGIQFHVADITKEHLLTSSLTLLSARLRKANYLASCSFCTEDDLASIYNQSEANRA
ncbi:PilZ domain-containing protein [Paenibacillus hexagrammi]|uniref:PilZ domain-containing protein n=1 Tax=Paenibacillus hexagrammi TaxID=2908839 RepID=A0ABY3SI46_9BACL|nr:PilZ domain-containing protein [Paenibacillus sp. YPD9-1]UJF32901.1 PilZ domain-containing protein [Paenibacillus sp. YPD9-1]